MTAARGAWCQLMATSGVCGKGAGGWVHCRQTHTCQHNTCRARSRAVQVILHQLDVADLLRRCLLELRAAALLGLDRQQPSKRCWKDGGFPHEMVLLDAEEATSERKTHTRSRSSCPHRTAFGSHQGGRQTAALTARQTQTRVPRPVPAAVKDSLCKLVYLVESHWRVCKCAHTTAHFKPSKPCPSQIGYRSLMTHSSNAHQSSSGMTSVRATLATAGAAGGHSPRVTGG